MQLIAVLKDDILLLANLVSTLFSRSVPVPSSPLAGYQRQDWSSWPTTAGR